MFQFQTMLFGGPNEYKGRDMVEAHKHMPIKMEHFDRVWEHMEKSYKKHQVSEELIKEIKEIVYSFTGQIVTVK